MGIEEDKPNNPVLITIFVIGGAAMLGGSAAIVGMTRVEMEQQSFELSGYADLDSVKELKDAQRKLLRESKLPIDKARDQLLADINRNPRSASWATPEPTEEPSAGGAGAVPSASASASAEPASTDAPGAGGAAAVPSPEATDEVAPQASAPEAPSHGKDAPTSPTPGAPAPDHGTGHGAPPAPAPEGTN